jgi:hypothetical protein
MWCSNMIDVSQPAAHEFSHTYTNHDRHTILEPDHKANDKPDAEAEDADEAAWLQSIQLAGLDSTAEIKGLRSGALVMDPGQLRTPSRATKSWLTEG